jgi:hypothetical protein
MHDRAVCDGPGIESLDLSQPRGAVQSCYGVEDAIDDVMGLRPHTSHVTGLCQWRQFRGVLRTFVGISPY